jgi:hypothetical protein
MSHMPPVPPDNSSPKGPGAGKTPEVDAGPKKKDVDRQRHLGQQGRQGNIKQNTTNQGYQQDR